MALSNLVVFSQYAKGSMTEVLLQQTDLFNTASRGAITLAVNPQDGDFSDLSFWKRIDGLVRRRNAYGSGAVTPVDLSQLKDTSVKVAAGTPPVNIPPSEMRWILKDPKESAVVYGQQLAIGMLGDMLNSAIAACRAALVQNGTATYYDGRANPLSWLAINSGQAKFGDRASRLAAIITHSKPVFDLWAGNLTNAQRLFTFGTVNVIADPWGRPIIMTDSPDLVNPGGIQAHVAAHDAVAEVPAIDSYYSLALVPGAVAILDNSDFEQNIQTVNGDENILRTIQSEWSFNVGVKGFAWDKTNGGKSPTTAALGTGTNWDKYASDTKDLAGVVIETK